MTGEYLESKPVRLPVRICPVGAGSPNAAIPIIILVLLVLFFIIPAILK